MSVSFPVAALLAASAFIVSAAYAGDSAEEDADALFRRIFKREPPPLPAAVYPIVIDGKERGETRVQLKSPADNVEVEPDGLMAALAPMVRPEVLGGLRGAAHDGALTLAELRQAGLGVRFDRQLLVLRVELPLSLRAVQTVRARSRRLPREPAELQPPAPLSALLNVRTAATYVHESDVDEQGWRHAVAGLSGAVRYADVVFEAGATYDPGLAQGPWRREETRFTVDDPTRAVRYQLGDVRSSSAGFQSPLELGGLRIGREFRLQPYVDFRPTEQRDFELVRPSRVGVLVNGVLVREFFLQPGRYNLEDIPVVAEATNNVQLRIVDDLGEIRLIDFTLFSDLELLAVGEHEFAYSLGAAREITPDGFDYDTERPLFAAFHNLGLLEDLTVGANLQWAEDQHLFGVHTVWASPVGSFLLDAAVSDTEAESEGNAWRVGYRWAEVPGTLLQREMDITASYTSRGFASLGDTTADNATAYSTLVRYGQHLGPAMRVQLGAQYRSARAPTDDSYTITAFLTRRIGMASVSLGLQHDRREGEEDNSVNLSLLMPLQGGALGIQYDSRFNSKRLGYSRFEGHGIGSTGINGGVTLGESGDEATGALTYIGNRYTAGIDHRADGEAGDTSESRTSLQFGTALVFAGGATALARPVVDSFAIIEPHPALADVKLAADPIRRPLSTEVSYNAIGDALGPPVVTDLRSYLYRSLAIEAPDAPTGISAAGQVISLKPGYRSGYRVVVGSANNVSVTGRLFDSLGEPVVLGVGEVVGDDGGTITFFTNRSGRFYIDQLAGGERYRLRVSGEQAGEAELALPGDAIGLQRIDAVRLH